MKEKLKYGVVGFSRNQFDKKTAYQLLDAIFHEIQQAHSNDGIAIEIVSGYTNSGVPKIAYELADKYGFITVGFSARQALKVRSGVYSVQKVILEGDRFGDESEAFIKYIDRLIRIGGGPQSRHETECFKMKNQGESLEGILIEREVDWYGN